MQPLSEPAMFRITSRQHPHFDEVGYLVEHDVIAATQQIRLELDNCRHGMVACYVTRADIGEVH